MANQASAPLCNRRRIYKLNVKQGSQALHLVSTLTESTQFWHNINCKTANLLQLVPLAVRRVESIITNTITQSTLF